jgi:hypothetical protein
MKAVCVGLLSRVYLVLFWFELEAGGNWATRESLERSTSTMLVVGSCPSVRDFPELVLKPCGGPLEAWLLGRTPRVL